jgi:hypothetical protein
MSLVHPRLVLLSLSLAVALTPLPAHACSCARVSLVETPRLSNGDPTPSREELAAKDLVVFVGKAEEVHTTTIVDGLIIESVTDFRVERIWDEELEERVRIGSPAPGGACGFVFKAGKRYVVFATRQEDGTLETTICDRTTLVEKVPDLLPHIMAIAGEGREPRTGQP